MPQNLIGTILLNQFRVDAFIAAGGMGAVYRVQDLRRNVPLAMKILHADLAEDPSIFKRFRREANALKKLAHPNIVPFYGLERTRDFAFLLEAYIDGPTLKDIMRNRRGTPFPIPEALAHLKALSAALSYAHANRVIHCDIKPGNVILDRGGAIYLTDFGIARHAESTTTTLAAAGTPAYMAPEQIRGEAVTPATDVYALGVLLFELLTGQRPFHGFSSNPDSGSDDLGETAAERIRRAHLTQQPPNPLTLNPTLPPALGQVILKALAKDPRQRYSGTMAFLTAACASIGINSEQVADRLQNSIPIVDTPRKIIEPGVSQLSPILPRQLAQRQRLVVIIAAAALIIVTGLFLALRGGISYPGINSTSQPGNVALPVNLAASATASGQGSQTSLTPTPGQMTIIEDISSKTPTLIPTRTQEPIRALSLTPTLPISNLPQGKIVFTCQIFNDANRDQICIINADGSGFRRLTNDASNAENYYASLAPDGMSVVFSSDRTGTKEIYEMDLNGNAHQLTHQLGEEAVAPEISPNGKQIVFTLKKNGRFGIWVMKRDGSNPHPVFGGATGKEAWDPTWSPDGSQILFSSNLAGGVQLFVIKPDSSNPRQVSNLGKQRGRSDWSADGKIIGTYAGDSWYREIYFMDPDGSNLRQVTNGGNNLAPSFSPDSRWFTFTSYMDNYGKDDGCEIYIMPVEGGKPTRLTNNNYCDYQPRWGP